MTLLRLVLGDQLDPCHPWFAEPRADVVVLMMEVRQETDYVLHHAQKILAIFAAMRAFAAQLAEAGHVVDYVAIDRADNRQSLPQNLLAALARHRATALAYQAPDEWRLDAQLAQFARQCDVPVEMCDSRHFLTTRDEAGRLFAGQRQWLMERFYRHMRSRHRVLLTADGRPEGGRWNFDADNRKRWPGTPVEPDDPRPVHDHSALWRTIEASGIRSFGNPQADCLRWPLNRNEALRQLRAFVTRALPHFGDFQDAMSAHAARLFHSQLSFALNTKMLSPREVVSAAEDAWLSGAVPLSAAEGFVRQILGWREYVRGVYWAHMPEYTARNALGHTRPLPGWFWTGQVGMRCLSIALNASLDQAHAHHIQRLMIIGNFALLAGLDPQAVHRWYLGVYVDAFEWVEAPNTLGMSQFADGGLLATKPYVSSAAYIARMSDYCRGCPYDRKARIGERACPFNALYWDFHQRHADRLGRNPRLATTMRQLQRMSPADRNAIAGQARQVLERIEDL